MKTKRGEAERDKGKRVRIGGERSEESKRRKEYLINTIIKVWNWSEKEDREEKCKYGGGDKGGFKSMGKEGTRGPGTKMKGNKERLEQCRART